MPNKINDWVIGKQIGSGGQGKVYEVSKGEAIEIAALKLIVTKWPKKAERFKQELDTHTKLSANNAPNIMPVLDFGVEETNGETQGYIVMPKAKHSLENKNELFVGRFELSLEIFSGIVRGIEYAHKAGVIHRDIKPANILFLDHALRQPMVTDFGICFLKDTATEERLTEVMETVGARFYMAPEQERGGRIDVTEAADIYALGKLLHFILTGRRLHREYVDRAFTPDELERDARLRLVQDQILAQTIIEDPSKRIATAAELQKVIQSVHHSDVQPPRIGLSRSVAQHSPPMAETKSDSEDGSPPTQDLQTLYSGFRDKIAVKATDEVAMQFDTFANRFDEIWARLYERIKDKPDQTPDAIRELTWSQPAVLALIFALGRCDATPLFPEVRRYIEWVTRATQTQAGYVAVQEVPFLYAGFLYMACAVSSLAREGWKVWKEIFNAPIGIVDIEHRKNFAPGFAQSSLFHSHIFGRSAHAAHDLYRELLTKHPEISGILRLRGDEVRDAYTQVQMLMCLKAAQCCEQGHVLRLWADFGRFYHFRAKKVFDHMMGDPAYASGVCSAFGETSDVFFERLNGRLQYIRQNFWGGGNFIWESLDEYKREN